jgi:hypothetical protein
VSAVHATQSSKYAAVSLAIKPQIATLQTNLFALCAKLMVAQVQRIDRTPLAGGGSVAIYFVV